MTTLLETLSQSITPDLLGKLSGAVGLDKEQVSSGMGVVGPVLSGLMANNSALAQPGALDGLLGQLPKDEGGGLLGMLGGAGGLAAGVGALTSLFGGGGAPAAGSSMLSALVGPGVSAVGGTLDRALGFKVGPLLAMAAPVVLNGVRKYMANRQLDAGAALKQIGAENQAFISAGGEPARIAREAIQAGQNAQTLQRKFSAEQWFALRAAPLAASRLVMLTDPSGPVGSVKELTAGAGVLSGALKDADPMSLLALAFEQLPSVDELKGMSQEPAALMKLITDAKAAVRQHAPEQASAFGDLLLRSATATAEASREGGFLGIGGVKISEAEQAVLDKIRAALA